MMNYDCSRFSSLLGSIEVSSLDALILDDEEVDTRFCLRCVVLVCSFVFACNERRATIRLTGFCNVSSSSVFPRIKEYETDENHVNNQKSKNKHHANHLCGEVPVHLGHNQRLDFEVERICGETDFASCFGSLANIQF